MSRGFTRERVYNDSLSIEENLINFNIDLQDPKIKGTLLLKYSYTNSQLFELCLTNYSPHYNKDRFYYEESNSSDNIWVSKGSTLVYNSVTNSVFEQGEAIDELRYKVNLTQDSLFMYHVTNWRYALDIIENGIDVDKGRSCLDFGQGKRFYLTDQSFTAIEYANIISKRSSSEVAILVYKVPKVIRKVLNSVDKEWKDLIVYSRQCKDTPILAFEEPQVIYGPMCCNPEQVKRGKQPKTHKPEKKQCAINKKGVNSITYIGSVFFNKKEKSVYGGRVKSNTLPNYNFTYDYIVTIFKKYGWKKINKTVYKMGTYRQDWTSFDIYSDIAEKEFKKRYEKYNGDFIKALQYCGITVKTYKKIVDSAKNDPRYIDSSKHFDLFNMLIISVPNT